MARKEDKTPEHLRKFQWKKGQVVNPWGRGGKPKEPPPPAHIIPPFQVAEGQTIQEILALTGPDYVRWAFERAGQAAQNGNDVLGAKIALLLVHKLVPASSGNDTKPPIPPGTKKEHLKALNKLLTELESDAEYQPVKPTTTLDGPNSGRYSVRARGEDDDQDDG